MTLHRFIECSWPAIAVLIAVQWTMVFSGTQVRNPKLWEAWGNVYFPTFAVFEFLAAVDYFIQRDYVTAAICGACATFVAYLWWNDENNRRKRKRLRDRAASRVANIAGRLRVVRPVEG